MPPEFVEEPRSDLLDQDITLISSRIGPTERFDGAFDRKTGDCLWVLTAERQYDPRTSSEGKVVGSLSTNGHMWVVLNNGYFSLSTGYPVVICDAMTGEELKLLPEFSAGYRVEYSAELVATEDTVAILEMGNSDRFTFSNRLGIRAMLQLYDSETLELVGSIPLNSTIPEELRARLSKFPSGIFTMGGYALTLEDNILRALELYHPFDSTPLFSGVQHRGQPHVVYDLGDHYFLTWWNYFDPEARYGGVDFNRQTLSIHRWVPGQALSKVWEADGEFGITNLGGVWSDGRFWSPAEGGKIVFFNRVGGRVFTLTDFDSGSETRHSYVHPSTKELLILKHGVDSGERYYLLSMDGAKRSVSFPDHVERPVAHEDGLLLRDRIGEGKLELVFGHLR